MVGINSIVTNGLSIIHFHPPVRHVDARILDVRHTRGLALLPSMFAGDAELQPDAADVAMLCMTRQGFVDDGVGDVARTEDVDDVDGARNVVQRRIAGNTLYVPCEWGDAVDGVAVVAEIERNVVGGLALRSRQTIDADGACIAEDRRCVHREFRISWRVVP